MKITETQKDEYKKVLALALYASSNGIDAAIKIANTEGIVFNKEIALKTIAGFLGEDAAAANRAIWDDAHMAESKRKIDDLIEAEAAKLRSQHQLKSQEQAQAGTIPASTKLENSRNIFDLGQIINNILKTFERSVSWLFGRTNNLGSSKSSQIALPIWATITLVTVSVIVIYSYTLRTIESKEYSNVIYSSPPSLRGDALLIDSTEPIVLSNSIAKAISKFDSSTVLYLYDDINGKKIGTLIFNVLPTNINEIRNIELMKSLKIDIKIGVNELKIQSPVN